MCWNKYIQSNILVQTIKKMLLITIILGIVTLLLVVLQWYQTKSRFAYLFNQFPMLPYKPLIGHVADFSSNPG